MSTVITIILAALILFPFPIAILYLMWMKKKGYAPVSQIGRAADWTTPFLFLAVYILARTVFGLGVGIPIVLIALTVGICYAIIERLRVKEFQIMRIMKKCWRLYFIVLTGCYVALITIGIAHQLVSFLK